MRIIKHEYIIELKEGINRVSEDLKSRFFNSFRVLSGNSSTPTTEIGFILRNIHKLCKHRVVFSNIINNIFLIIFDLREFYKITCSIIIYTHTIVK